jgi:hypothetical protein
MKNNDIILAIKSRDTPKPKPVPVATPSLPPPPPVEVKKDTRSRLRQKLAQKKDNKTPRFCNFFPANLFLAARPKILRKASNRGQNHFFTK